MNENRVYPLYLRHSDIQTTTTTQTVDNGVGGWSAYKQTTYWYVNMKTLLGSDWDKYNIFSIGLKQLSASAVAYQTTAPDTLWNSYISGLIWCETSYNPVTRNQGNRAILFTGLIPNSANTQLAFVSPITNCFFKGDAMVKITLEHFRVLDGTAVISTVGLPHSVFFFDIKGVE